MTDLEQFQSALADLQCPTCGRKTIVSGGKAMVCTHLFAAFHQRAQVCQGERRPGEVLGRLEVELFDDGPARF